MDDVPNAPSESILLRTLIEALPDFVFAKDLQGHFLMVNPSCAQSLGEDSPADVVGKTDADFLAPEFASKFAADEKRIADSGMPLLDLEEKFQGPDGSVRWFSTSKLPVKAADGTVIAILGIARDVTLRHELINSLNQQTMELRHRNLEIEASLRVAERFYQSMVPDHPPVAPSPSDAQVKLTILQHFQPHDGFGGDFFHIRVIDDARVGVLICDVTGHDVRSALLAATINGLKEQLRSEASRASSYISALNSRLYGILETTAREMFATASYLVADVRSGNVCCVRAGHPKALRRNAEGEVDGLGSTGPALGLFEDASYPSDMVEVEPGDRILLYGRPV